MKISDKNIRATALQEFWSDEYSESLYLWQGARHNCTLSEIDKSTIPTHKDLFSTQEEIQEGHEFCKKFYYRVLPELSSKLNKVHDLDLSDSFWQTTFGYWLYRHISVVYDKYVYLNKLDIDSTSIKLLNVNDFYIPQNHEDYIRCFASDFGVQQLVSQYCYLFKTKEFSIINKTFTYDSPPLNNNTISSQLRRKLLLLSSEPQVALLNVFFSERTCNQLHELSEGKIGNIILPSTNINSISIDLTKRRFIANFPRQNNFEYYFFQSLHYCIPKDFLENFTEYYSVFQKDLTYRKFTHIVSEAWISSIPTSIYIALAKEDKRIFVAHEHSAGTNYYKNGLQFIDYDVADRYLSVGWKENTTNFIQGGFTCRDVIPYEYDPVKETILYISRTKYVYWEEFNEYLATNSSFIKELKVMALIIELLPSVLREKFLFRPRTVKYLWDVESLLELDKHNVKIDKGNFAESVSKSKIVIIDHMSTAFAEILQMKVPFILVYDVNFLPMSDELKKIFDELIDCGVVHISAPSAISHLTSIYDDVEGWWQSEQVCCSVRQLIDVSLLPASKTTGYLLSLLSSDFNKRPTLVRQFWSLVAFFARLAFRAFKKMKTLIS
jgi:putative transferase (TIGR04331 family)